MHPPRPQYVTALSPSRPHARVSNRLHTRESLRQSIRPAHKRPGRPPSRAKYTAALRLEQAKLRRCAQRLYFHFKYVDSDGVLRDASRSSLQRHQIQLRRLRAELVQKEGVHTETLRRLQLIKQLREGEVHSCIELAMGRRGAHALNGLHNVRALRKRIAVLENVLVHEGQMTMQEEREIRWEVAFLREMGEQFVGAMESEALGMGQMSGIRSDECALKACNCFLEMMKVSQNERLQALGASIQELDNVITGIMKRREEERGAAERTQKRIETIMQVFESDVAGWERLVKEKKKKRSEQRPMNADRRKLSVGQKRLLKPARRGALTRRAAIAAKV